MRCQSVVQPDTVLCKSVNCYMLLYNPVHVPVHVYVCFVGNGPEQLCQKSRLMHEH